MPGQCLLGGERLTNDAHVLEDAAELRLADYNILPAFQPYRHLAAGPVQALDATDKATPSTLPARRAAGSHLRVKPPAWPRALSAPAGCFQQH